MTDTALAPTDLCRSEFEAWHIAEVRKIFPVDGWSDAEIIEGTAGPRRHGSYRADGMQRAWKAWQAAWNRRAPAPASGETETCKCCSEGSARIVVRRECDTCTSVYAGVAEHRLQKSLAAPPAQEARVPLSDEQKREMVAGYFAEDWAIENALHLLDDFERHGITAAQKPQVPLRDEQIFKAYTTATGKKLLKLGHERPRLLQIFRLAEAIHGITAAQKETPC